MAGDVLWMSLNDERVLVFVDDGHVNLLFGSTF